MCHGHVDLRTIEREVQDRLRASKPAPKAATEDEPITVPPSLIGGLPGLVTRVRLILKGRRQSV